MRMHSMKLGTVSSFISSIPTRPPACKHPTHAEQYSDH